MKPDGIRIFEAANEGPSHDSEFRVKWVAFVFVLSATERDISLLLDGCLNERIDDNLEKGHP